MARSVAHTRMQAFTARGQELLLEVLQVWHHLQVLVVQAMVFAWQCLRAF